MKADTFEAAHIAIPAPLGPWREQTADGEREAFAQAVKKLSEMENGNDIIVESEELRAWFRNDLLIRYVGGAEGHREGLCHGFLFTVPGRLEVIAWIADDDTFHRVRWRGDEAIMSRLALDLYLFGDDLLVTH
jgi:hypothetical protein